MDNANSANPPRPGATKLRILAFLRRASRTVPEIAAHLGLTGNAVRLHLAALERDRLVAPRGQRPTARRPATLYALTSNADHLLAKPYAAVLSAILGSIREHHGDAELARHLRQIGRQLGSERAARVAGLQGRALVEELAAIINELGGIAEVEGGSEGQFTLTGHSCPLVAVVSDHAEACTLTQAMLETLVGPDQVRGCCTRGDEIRCCFAINLKRESTMESWGSEPGAKP